MTALENLPADPVPRTGTKKQTGPSLGRWMRRVARLAQRAERDFAPDTVHDLRVALRRCRSIAAALETVDPDPAWRKMQRASRKLFRRLGALRDAQVLREWVERLAPETDPVRRALVAEMDRQEAAGREAARAALASFDAKKWKKWTRKLPERARCVPAEGARAVELARARWAEARRLDRRARRSRSQADWHGLRIGLKRFRYTVENFLPRRHESWGADLKRLQDLLGEVHDLDVLRQQLPRAGAAWDARARRRWHARIAQERQTRLEEYRRRMTGPGSLWELWRAGLDGRAAGAIRRAAAAPWERRARGA